MPFDFSQFKAKPATHSIAVGASRSSWLTVKKRGKDDFEIEKAKKHAELERKKRNGTLKKKRKVKVLEDDDSEMDDFIVHDDDDSKLHRVSAESTEHGTSDDESTGILDHTKDTSRRSRPMSRDIRRMATTIKKPVRQMKEKPRDEEDDEMEELDTDKDDDYDDVNFESQDKEDEDSILGDDRSEKVEKKLVMKAAIITAAKFVDLLSSSESSEDSPIRSSGNMKHRPEFRDQKSKSRPSTTKTHTTFDLLSDGDDEESPIRKSKKQMTKSAKGNLVRRNLRHFGSDDEETPAQRKGVEGRRSIQDESDDDNPFDVPDDENEQIAIALALSQSAKEAKTSDNVVAAFKEMEDDESDDNEGDVQDAFVDREEAKEASYVLSAANQLSAQVLQTMKAWSGDATKGMIVDGALAMHTINSQTTPHSWISQEEIRKLLPQVKLADYQLIGVNWLALLHGMKVTLQGSKKKTNVNGVLADVMGLGKTVQTIAFLAWLRKKNRIKLGLDDVLDDDFEDTDDEDLAQKGRMCNQRPHLIVVPSSVLSNWQNEFAKFCPEMKVVKYHGGLKERAEIQQVLRRHLPGGAGQHEQVDVILTTYSYFSSEKDTDRSFLKKFSVDYLIVDEAHCLKNPNGARYQNLDKFKTSHRLLLTGTPVQNSPEELMSLLCFLMPLFAEGAQSEFGDEQESRAQAGQKMLRHFVEMEGGDVKDAGAAYRKLKQLFAPFVLRRRKEDVLSQILPPKTRKLELLPFDEATRKVYDGILDDHVKRQGKGPMDSSTQQHLFTQLRKAANHPLLLRTRYTSDDSVKHLTTRFFEYGYFGRDSSCTIKHVQQELEKMSDFDIHLAALEIMDENPCRASEIERYTLQQSDLFSSPKFERLRTLLPELIRDGHRVLIFSQWTKCMDLLGCLMEFLDLKFFRLDGQTQISTRQDMIDKFNKDISIPVFLLSTRAGGMGINLTAADVCILHDLDFNPFNDLQAEDRCHRIGQTKRVTVIKMITSGTVDADIYEMQQRKAKMNAAILADSGGPEETKEVVCKLLTNALDRFLLSPAAEKKRKSEVYTVL